MTGMPSRSTTRTAATMGPWKAALAATAGSVLEYYDFFVYGPLAALVFGQVFFASGLDPAVATLLSLLTFFAGFLARPLGGMVIGHFGDRIGRKRMLILTFMITGVATILIGLLPTYAQLGAAAPILLLVLRMLQGVGIGGEWGGAALLAVETAPAHRRNFFGAVVQAGAPIGVILSSGTVAIVTSSMSRADLLAWGWRIPFLASIVLVVLGLVLRLHITDTPEFQELQARAERDDAVKPTQLPLLEAVKRYPRQLLAMVGLHTSDTTLGLINGVFVIGFATNVLQMDAGLVLLTNIASATANFVCTPIAGRLADRFGARRVLVPATIFLGLWAFPAFMLIESRSYLALFFVMVVGGMLIGTLFSPQASLFAWVLPPHVRYTGMSVGFQVGTVIGGGAGPVIAQWLQARADGDTTLVSVYVAVVAVVALISVLYLTRRGREFVALEATR